MGSSRGRRLVKSVTHKLTFNLDVITFEEDKVFYMACPPLDITGYGYTATEAKQSFETMLQEFLRYTINKRTLFTELERLGWQRQNPGHFARIVPPTIDTVKQTNDDLSRVMSSIPFQSHKTKVAIPVC